VIGSQQSRVARVIDRGFGPNRNLTRLIPPRFMSIDDLIVATTRAQL
jgi:hypothetical protein